MILHSMHSLLKSAEKENILQAIDLALERSDEAPFWRQKTIPLCDAILSVLIPLRSQGLLFDPEGNPAHELDESLFLRWCDLLSLKTLAFTLSKSNESKQLERTKYTAEQSSKYNPIDLEILGQYLSSYSVNLTDEWVDFPITNYNLHIGITSVVTKTFKQGLSS